MDPVNKITISQAAFEDEIALFEAALRETLRTHDAPCDVIFVCVHPAKTTKTYDKIKQAIAFVPEEVLSTYDPDDEHI